MKSFKFQSPMTDKKQILIAFLIPFILAVSLSFLGDYILPDGCTSTFELKGKTVCLEYHDETWIETFYGLFILGLFILSLFLPLILFGRAYQRKKVETE